MVINPHTKQDVLIYEELPDQYTLISGLFHARSTMRAVMRQKRIAAFGLKDWRDEQGDLIFCTFPGGYTVVYQDKEANVYCPDCANGFETEELTPDEESLRTRIICGDLYQEGPPIWCDGCGKMIESDYGDPDAEEEEIHVHADS